jgi:hypothetical protein
MAARIGTTLDDSCPSPRFDRAGKFHLRLAEVESRRADVLLFAIYTCNGSSPTKAVLEVSIAAE